MTIKKKMILSAITFIIFAAALQIALSAIITMYGFNRYIAYQWLFYFYNNSFNVYNSKIFQRLERDAYILLQNPEITGALKRSDWNTLDALVNKYLPSYNEKNFWIAVSAAGKIESNFPECAKNVIGLSEMLALGKTHQFILCDKIPIMTATSTEHNTHNHPALLIAMQLDDLYVQDLKNITAMEVSLWGEEGKIVSTYRDINDKPVSFPLPDEVNEHFKKQKEPYFGIHWLTIPSYKGLELPVGMGLKNKKIEEGKSEIKSYILTGYLDKEDRVIPVRVVLSIPFKVVFIVVQYSIIALTLLTAGLTICLIFIVWWVVSRFTHTLTSLVEATTRVANGDLTIEIPAKGDLEIVELITAFNTMTKKLKESRDFLIQSEKMVAIGKLAGGIAHEINNPLGIILGFAQGMERRVAEGDPLRLPVTSIVREALRSKTLVQELLTFSRPIKKITEDFDLNSVIREAVILIEARAKTQNVQVRLDLAEGLPVIRGNKLQIHQVVINLGTNSMDAMKDGGNLTLRTILKSRNDVCIEVSDTGCGISKDILPNIFDPFFTTKEIGKGTGIGLSIVYETINQHGGRISVKSEVGKGTTMYLCLPVGYTPEGGK